jgi:SAM-dependent methyltransferase
MEDRRSSVKDQNTQYYDQIADDYDELLQKEPQNTAVRQKVEKLFKQFVPQGTILDFGGGTGQDLSWMANHGYKVYFCEPSSKMRKIAMTEFESLTNHQIMFLDDSNADFTVWPNQSPFPEKVDAILSNFAVLNSIADVEAVFIGLSSVLRPGGHAITLVLDGRRKMLLKKHLKAFVKSIFFSRPIVSKIHYKGFSHLVYLHSYQKLKMAAHPHFIVNKKSEFIEFGFMLLHFIKK